jgi:hypothetical protein
MSGDGELATKWYGGCCGGCGGCCGGMAGAAVGVAGAAVGGRTVQRDHELVEQHDQLVLERVLFLSPATRHSQTGLSSGTNCGTPVLRHARRFEWRPRTFAASYRAYRRAPARASNH